MRLAIVLLASLLASLLAACAAPNEPGTRIDDQVDSSADAPESIAAPEDAEDCEAVFFNVCTRPHHDCGHRWACGGQVWTCGVCEGGQVCGDQVPFQCGLDCNGMNYRAECAAMGAPAGYGVSTACVRTPYLLDAKGARLAREQGRDGCVVQDGLVCCP